MAKPFIYVIKKQFSLPPIEFETLEAIERAFAVKSYIQEKLESSGTPLLPQRSFTLR